MPTKVALAALAVTALALAGCQSTDAKPAQPVAGPATSAAPAGNGVAALTADEILEHARAAVKKTKSVHAQGAVVEDGQQTEIDLKVDGADFAGSMVIGKAKVELLQVGGKKYFRPNEAFWVLSTDAKQGKTLAKGFGSHWIAGAENDKSFADMFSVGDIDELLKPTGALSKGDEKVISGVPAITLKDAGDPDSALYIATTGEPYPLQMTSKGGSAIVFDSFGEKFAAIAKPAAAQIVDLGKVGG